MADEAEEKKKTKNGRPVGSNKLEARPMNDAMRVESIKDLMIGLTSPDTCDIIAAMARNLKVKMTENPINAGDMVYLSENCSPILRKYVGKPIEVKAIGRDGSITVMLDGVEGKVSRDKLVYKPTDIPKADLSESEFGDER